MSTEPEQTSSDIAISLTDVWVQYRLRHAHHYNLKRSVTNLLTHRKDKVEVITALQGVSLSVPKGARIGLTGPNGAGKSTLLAVMAGALTPTRGAMKTNGRVLALLGGPEQGLDPEQTGRENALSLGIRLGESPAVMQERLDEIKEFSGLGARFDHPVYSYSSGMQVRLRFSTITSIQADILLVDEGIGAADVEFNERATLRLSEFYGNSGTLVISSHDKKVIENHGAIPIQLDASELQVPASGSSAQPNTFKVSPRMERPRSSIGPVKAPLSSMSTQRPLVIIHPGWPKTGTSAVQSALAQIRPQLAALGIAYPNHPSLGAAAAGRVTSGNVSPLDANTRRPVPDWFDDQILQPSRISPGFQRYVFSNERLSTVGPQLLASISANSDEFDFRVVVAVRDPLELLSSGYQQSLKRGGYTKSFSNFLSEGKGLGISTLRHFIEAMEECQTDYSLVNYSTLGDSFVSRVLTLMGIPESLASVAVSKTRVNRSMTHAEAQLLMLLNATLPGKISDVVSTSLVNGLPRTLPQPIYPSRDAWNLTRERLEPDVAFINSRLPPDQQLGFNELDTQETRFFYLGGDEARVAGKALTSALKEWPEAATVDALRDIAVRIDEGCATLSDALSLMQMAQHHRPEGPFITRKVEEYQERLSPHPQQSAKRTDSPKSL